MVDLTVILDFHSDSQTQIPVEDYLETQITPAVPEEVSWTNP